MSLLDCLSLTVPQKCLRVLGLANRIHELIEKKKSYAALRALDGIPFVYNAILT
jgi:hypothetical protein